LRALAAFRRTVLALGTVHLRKIGANESQR
jgi:hypothetical protein